ncbi:DUF2921 family protein [Melia azedarach]|uniref:DUF2921 family protein n=1 Tax=Melia azedarach TaxID=155640 RepID=A0ACC1XAN4_MELAZ|nr:DUF2921 family protein [Melia azedarach]
MISLIGVLSIGITRNCSFGFDLRRKFYMMPGMSVLSIPFEGIYTESDEKGGEQFLCMLRNSTLPYNKWTNDPLNLAKGYWSNYDNKPPLLQDDQILLVLRSISGEYFRVVPNWKFKNVSLYAGKLGPFQPGKEIKAADWRYSNVRLVMEHINCEQGTYQNNLGLGGCNSQISLYFPRAYSIKQRSMIYGSISSINDEKESFLPIIFDAMVRPGLLKDNYIKFLAVASHLSVVLMRFCSKWKESEYFKAHPYGLDQLHPSVKMLGNLANFHLLVVLLLTAKLFQKVSRSRKRLHACGTTMKHVPSDKLVLLVILTFHSIGFLLLLVLDNILINPKNDGCKIGYILMLGVWMVKLEEYVGLVQDFFLLPQIIANFLWHNHVKSLSRRYYIGLASVRLLYVSMIASEILS